MYYIYERPHKDRSTNAFEFVRHACLEEGRHEEFGSAQGGILTSDH